MKNNISIFAVVFIVTLFFTQSVIAVGVDEFTKFLLHADGVDGSTSFVDDSLSAHTVNAQGDIQINTAEKKFGTGSAIFDGSADRLQLPSSTDWAIGNSDFTIDTWVKLNSSKIQHLVNNGTYNDSAIWLLGVDASNKFYFNKGTGGWAWTTAHLGESEALTLDTWHHIAVVRSGNTLHLFLDGQLLTGYSTVIGDFSTEVHPLYMGTYFSSTLRPFDGHMDEFRISKGIARWTSNFTPPIAPYSEPVSDITIQNPDNAEMSDVVNEGYITVDNGTIDNTTQTTTQVQVTFQSNTTNAIFPTNTVITESLNGNFNFENFITQNTLNEERGDHPNAVGAVRLGIPNENLTFSNDITMEITVSEAYNDMELEVLSQLEGEVTWNTHTTCTVTNGICTFTTNHATTYIVNGDGTISGIDDLNLNVEVNATLSMDCYDKDGVTGDYDVILGTIANPGIVIAGTPAVGQSTCIVTTNDTQGYYLSMINDNGASNTTLVHSNNTDEIPDLTQFNETTKVTESWNAPTTKGLGFSVTQFPQADTTNNTFNNVWTTSGNLCEEGITNDDADYAGVPQTAQAVAAHTAYNSTSTTTDVCYKVDVSPSQPSGVYTGSVTYTATSDASGFWQ
jgi:concanavalin A-like lectin/glucanase superfamily protein